MTKKYLIILFCFFPYFVAATSQMPDILIYKGKKLKLQTSWRFPAILDQYFLQQKMLSPFDMWHTANYRGHIATWRIRNNKLFLSCIELEDTTDDFSTIKYTPSEWNRDYLPESLYEDKKVFAAWFSGVIMGVRLIEKSMNYKAFYYFHIRHGNLVGVYKTKEHFYDMTSFPPLVHMYKNYVNFWYRLKGDSLILNDTNCHLKVGKHQKSPIFSYYGTDFLDWPFNWENPEKSDRPLCTWKIRNDSLFLEGIHISYQTMEDSLVEEKVDLSDAFSDKLIKGKVFADWVDGLYIIEHGSLNKSANTGYKTFEATHCSMIEVEKGLIKLSLESKYSFQFLEMAEKESPAMYEKIKAYFWWEE